MLNSAKAGGLVWLMGACAAAVARRTFVWIKRLVGEMERDLFGKCL